jgi:hypothetical protein
MGHWCLYTWRFWGERHFGGKESDNHFFFQQASGIVSLHLYCTFMITELYLHRCICRYGNERRYLGRIVTVFVIHGEI